MIVKGNPEARALDLSRSDDRLAIVYLSHTVFERVLKLGSEAISIVSDPVPLNAQLRTCGYDPVRASIYLVFEHHSFPPAQEGGILPEIRPLFQEAFPDRPRLPLVLDDDDWATLGFRICPLDPTRAEFGAYGEHDWIKLDAPIGMLAAGPLGVMFQCYNNAVYMLTSDTGKAADQSAWRIRVLARL